MTYVVVAVGGGDGVVVVATAVVPAAGVAVIASTSTTTNFLTIFVLVHEVQLNIITTRQFTHTAAKCSMELT